MMMATRSPESLPAAPCGCTCKWPLARATARRFGRDIAMDWVTIEENGLHFKEHVKAKWGRLTDENPDSIAGKRAPGRWRTLAK